MCNEKKFETRFRARKMMKNYQDENKIVPCGIYVI